MYQHPVVGFVAAAAERCDGIDDAGDEIKTSPSTLSNDKIMECLLPILRLYRVSLRILRL